MGGVKPKQNGNITEAKWKKGARKWRERVGGGFKNIAHKALTIERMA